MTTYVSMYRKSFKATHKDQDKNTPKPRLILQVGFIEINRGGRWGSNNFVAHWKSVVEILLFSRML